MRVPAHLVTGPRRARRPPLRRSLRRHRWRLVAGALGGATAISGLATVDQADQARHRWGEVVVVAAASEDLPAGRVLAAVDLVARELPAAAVPDGAVDGDVAGQRATSPEAALERLVGRTVTQAVLRGEVVSDRRLAPAGLGPTAALVPSGHRAVAVPLAGAMPPLATGDRVDLLAAPGGNTAAGWPGAGTIAGSLADVVGRGDVRTIVRDVAVLDTAGDALTVVVPVDRVDTVVAATLRTTLVPVLAGN